MLDGFHGFATGVIGLASYIHVAYRTLGMKYSTSPFVIMFNFLLFKQFIIIGWSCFCHPCCVVLENTMYIYSFAVLTLHFILFQLCTGYSHRWEGCHQETLQTVSKCHSCQASLQGTGVIKIGQSQKCKFAQVLVTY